MNHRKEIAEQLLQINAIKLSPDRPFTWASGWKSPIYCDNRLSLSYPDLRTMIKESLTSRVKELYGAPEVIAGVATAGIPWGMLVADHLNLPFCYVRPKPKEHGLGNQIEGRYTAGMKTVVIEDLVSTGKSSLQAVDALIHAGGNILGVVSIFNYSFEKATVAFAEAKLPSNCILDYPFLIQVAREKAYIRAEDENTLLNWRADPQKWGESF